MTDKIVVSGIKFHGFHGLTKLERKIGVRYRVDVELFLDLEGAVRSDRIRDTVDYRRVHDLIVEIGRGESHRLIETLAGRIVDGLLSKFAVDAVRVRLQKETPVLDGIVEGVGVEMSRQRPRARSGSS
jgi:dihydroneopterin aldolase